MVHEKGGVEIKEVGYYVGFIVSLFLYSYIFISDFSNFEGDVENEGAELLLTHIRNRYLP